jgi:hypothetical protein
LDIPRFREVTKHYEGVWAEVKGAVKGTEDLLEAAPKEWDDDAAVRQFTGNGKENVEQLIGAATTALGLVDDFVTTAGGTSARDRTMEESSMAVVADFGGEVGWVG